MCALRKCQRWLQKCVPILTDTTESLIAWETASTRWLAGTASVYAVGQLNTGLLTTATIIVNGRPRLVNGPSARLSGTLQVVRPNPVSDEVTITLGATTEGAYTLSLVNVLGERFVLKEWQQTAGSDTTTNEITLSLRRFASGVYTLMLSTPTGREARLIHVER
jgi:hypothetical protein